MGHPLTRGGLRLVYALACAKIVVYNIGDNVGDRCAGTRGEVSHCTTLGLGRGIGRESRDRLTRDRTRAVSF